MKIRSVTALFLLCATPTLCKAQLVITEVMYDPPATDYGHEWIEVYNAGDATAVLTQDKIFEGGAKHNIIAAGSPEISPGSYAVIAQNAADLQKDHPDLSEHLFHSAISLDNGGATIQIVDASSSVLASATYDSTSGALGDGNSLQRAPTDEAFVARTPSPGAPISSSVVPAKTKPVATKKSTAHASTTPKSKQGSTEESAGYAQRASDTATAVPSQGAAVDSSQEGNSSVWWIAAAALALASAAALVVIRRVRNGEWNIVEET